MVNDIDVKNDAREIKEMCRQNKSCYGCPFCRGRQCVLTLTFPDEWDIDGEEETE